MFHKFNTAFDVSFEFFVGECKFKKSQFDKTEYEKLMDKIKYLPVSNPLVCIFVIFLAIYNSPKKNITKRRKISLQNAEKHDN